MTANAHKILVVDDEPPIVDILSYNLKRAGYDVIAACNGADALAQARRERPDLIILDLMLPQIDGFEVCRILRRESDVPIVMLTARDAEIDRVVGLELGADDYVVKPFSVRELLARVKNILRRAAQPQSDEKTDTIRVGIFSINAARREACIGAVRLELTALEFDILYVLANNPGLVMTREKLIEKVWGYDYYGDARVVDAVIKRLRKKLQQAAPGTEIVATIRGVGYKLSDETKA